jgi:hypothetical protein
VRHKSKDETVAFVFIVLLIYGSTRYCTHAPTSNPIESTPTLSGLHAKLGGRIG